MFGRKTAAAVIVSTVMLFSGCMKRSIEPLNCSEFSDKMYQKGFCSREDGVTSDSEDGTSVIIQAKNGWLAGFYECSDREVAENEFNSVCNAAGIESFSGGDSYGIGEKTTDSSYYYYAYTENTCLFMIGTPDNAEEIKDFAKELGYTEE